MPSGKPETHQEVTNILLKKCFITDFTVVHGKKLYAKATDIQSESLEVHIGVFSIVAAAISHTSSHEHCFNLPQALNNDNVSNLLPDLS